MLRRYRTAAQSATGESIAATVVDLFLPDSQGIETFDLLFHASPHVPILVVSSLRDEDVARLAVQRGAQDYLLKERLDGYTLPKAVTTMLARSAQSKARLLEEERRASHAQLDRGCSSQHRRRRQRDLPQSGR